MAEIASFGVDVDENTKLAQNAQDTADNAASGVTNLNDPNLMSVIEKQYNISQFAGLTSQYNVILARAKEDNISTTALTTAYTNLNTFMAAILTDTTKASDVDRDTYKRLTDAYNTALSNVQTALSDSFNTDISNMQSDVSVASQAASSAVIVASQATVTGNSASQVASQVAVVASQASVAGSEAVVAGNQASQAASGAILAGSTAAVKADKAITAASQAQIAGDNATSVANNASQAASNAILAGSTATASANKASADYQTLSAGVKDGSVVHITTETVIDKEVIGTAEIANGAITNAQIGKEAVGSAQIADLAVGTAQIGDGSITNAKIGKLAVGTAQIADGAITNAQIGKLAVGTAQIGDGAITNAKIGKLAVGTAQIANAAITDAKVGSISANKLTAGTIDFNTITGKNINASNITTGKLDTDRLNVDKLSAVSANLGDVITGSLKGVDIVANTFSTPNGSFTTDANGAITATNMTINGGTLTSPTINAGEITATTKITGTDIEAPIIHSPSGSFKLDGKTGDIIGASIHSADNSWGIDKNGNINGVDIKIGGTYSYVGTGSSQVNTGAIYNELDSAGYHQWTSENDHVRINNGVIAITNDADEKANVNVEGIPLGVFISEGNTQLTGSLKIGNIYTNGVHTINSIDGSALWLEKGEGSGNSMVDFHAGVVFTNGIKTSNLSLNNGHTIASADGGTITMKDSYNGGGNYVNLTVKKLTQSSLLSVKTDITPIDPHDALTELVKNDVMAYHYKTDPSGAHKSVSVVLDDVNPIPKYYTSDIFKSDEGDSRNDGTIVGYLMLSIKDLNSRLQKLEGTN